jgi:uncharacterized protein DUF1905/bacteriocin resistance YdeI/OmpD-like protein
MQLQSIDFASPKRPGISNRMNKFLTLTQKIVRNFIQMVQLLPEKSIGGLTRNEKNANCDQSNCFNAQIMVQFSTTILQFKEQGEKTGWNYIHIPATLAQQLKPGNRKSFRVKGKLDEYQIKGISLMPMGEGDFIMALKASIRKAIKKNRGAKLVVQLELDNDRPMPPAEFIECLKDEPAALSFFNQLSHSHQNYFSNWIKSAKTNATKARRIAHSVNALSKKFDFGKMLRSLKQDKEDFFR